jgi:hypothetical protein
MMMEVERNVFLKELNVPLSFVMTVVDKFVLQLMNPVLVATRIPEVETNAFFQVKLAYQAT